MIKPSTIKDLTRKAISLLEAAYFPQGVDPRRPSLPGLPPAALLAAQLRQLTALSKSPDRTSALVLANTVTHLALERKTPTLLVTAKYSPPIFVVNLLLWRAGISLEEVVSPAWNENQFARLAVASREIANAPLLVVRSLPLACFRKMILAAAASFRMIWVITDDGTQSLADLKETSRQLGVPITIVLSDRVGPPP